MALEKIEKVKGKAVFVPGNDIDTDRIIPARFMVCVTFEGLGKYAFYDERKNPDGTDKKHPLTDPRRQNAKILLSGENFGCGSSREHAPIAIRACGVSCVIAASFARIFYRNSINIGFPILECPEAAQAIQNGDAVSVDFATGVIRDDTTGQTFQAAAFPPFIQRIIEHNGLLPYLKARMDAGEVR